MTKDRYLFRGFHKEENGKETIYIDGQPIKGEWIEGYLVEYIQKDTIYMNSTSPKESYIFPMDERSQLKSLEKRVEVIPETIGQYINRLDKDNEKIFEGCRCKHFINADFIVAPEGVVEYLDDRYILRYNGRNYTNFMFIKSKDILITGTKFDKEVNDNESNN